jgi:hypothetical protein
VGGAGPAAWDVRVVREVGVGGGPSHGGGADGAVGLLGLRRGGVGVEGRCGWVGWVCAWVEGPVARGMRWRSRWAAGPAAWVARVAWVVRGVWVGVGGVGGGGGGRDACSGGALRDGTSLLPRARVRRACMRACAGVRQRKAGGSGGQDGGGAAVQVAGGGGCKNRRGRGGGDGGEGKEEEGMEGGGDSRRQVVWGWVSRAGLPRPADQTLFGAPKCGLSCALRPPWPQVCSAHGASRPMVGALRHGGAPPPPPPGYLP